MCELWEERIVNLVGDRVGGVSRPSEGFVHLVGGGKIFFELQRVLGLLAPGVTLVLLVAVNGTVPCC